MNNDIRYLVDEQGAIMAVQIPYELWKQVENLLPNKRKKDAQHQEEQPLRDFETLQQYWDFHYPYEPKVTCPHCHAQTNDWRNDPAQPFLLTNATLGGLLVFHCKACGTTIRHKYFPDHVAYEHSTPKKV